MMAEASPRDRIIASRLRAAEAVTDIMKGVHPQIWRKGWPQSAGAHVRGVYQSKDMPGWRACWKWVEMFGCLRIWIACPDDEAAHTRNQFVVALSEIQAIHEEAVASVIPTWIHATAEGKEAPMWCVWSAHFMPNGRNRGCPIVTLTEDGESFVRSKCQL